MVSTPAAGRGHASARELQARGKVPVSRRAMVSTVPAIASTRRRAVSHPAAELVMAIP